MEQTLAEFEHAADKVRFEVQKALLPLGIYAFKVSSILGTGMIAIESRFIDFGSKQELQLLKEGLLLECLDEETLASLRERGLIP